MYVGPAAVELVETSIGRIGVRRTRVRGPGPHEPAVPVHGLGGNSLNWVGLAEALSDRLECVSPDLSGFGATEPLADEDFSIAAHSRAVVAAIETLSRGRRYTCSATRWAGRSRFRWRHCNRTWCAP